HAGALEHAGGGGAGTDGPGGPVDPVGTVGGAEAPEAVALHGPGRPLALADGGHVDPLAGRQEVGPELLAHLVAGGVVEAQLDEALAGLDAVLGVVAGRCLGELAGGLRPVG